MRNAVSHSAALRKHSERKNKIELKYFHPLIREKMKAETVDVKIDAKVDSYLKNMDKATKAAERLKEALEAVNGTEILVTVRRVNKNWWEFWK